MTNNMTEKEFFATGGPVDAILEARGMPLNGKFGREAMLDGWFTASTDHGFDAEKTAQGILDEVAVLNSGDIKRMKLNTKVCSLARLIDNVQPSRFTLAGILYDGQTAVVTDGHQLTKVFDKDAALPVSEPILISCGVLNAAKKLKAPKYLHPDAFSVEVENGDELTLKSTLLGEVKTSQVFEKLTGTFPNYQRVIPDDERLPLHFNYDANLLIKVLQTHVEIAEKKKGIVSVELLLGDPSDSMKIKSTTDGLEVESTVMPVRDTSKEDRRLGEAIYKSARQVRENWNPENWNPDAESND
jgi:hypothetical protein